MKIEPVSKVQPAKVGTRMLAVKDEQGNILREFPASTWQPPGGFPYTEIKSTEITFKADEEGEASQIMWKEISDDSEKQRRLTVAKYPHADPATLFYSAQSQKYGVIIRCTLTGEVRRVWTSDLHQVLRSEKAQAMFRRDQQRQKRADLAAAR